MKNEILKTEIDFIKSEEIRKFTELAIDSLPDYYWHVPASSSGKYHPVYALGDGGLIRHTIAAVTIANSLLELEQYRNIFDDRFHDCIISGLILHDGFKQGKSNDGNGRLAKDHAVICAEWIRTDSLFDKSFKDINDRELISEIIRTHMGEWDVKNKPETASQKFAHMCDFLASRKNILFDFGTRITTLGEDGQVGPTPIVECINPGEVVWPFGKYSGKTISEIYSSNSGYFRWALDNMSSLKSELKNTVEQFLKEKN
jgi:hypothetical protein